MKKVLFACLCLASAALTGCGNDCADLADKMRECCADITEATSKAACEAVADAVEEEGEDCDPDAYECAAPQ